MGRRLPTTGMSRAVHVSPVEQSRIVIPSSSRRLEPMELRTPVRQTTLGMPLIWRSSIGAGVATTVAAKARAMMAFKDFIVRIRVTV